MDFEALKRLDDICKIYLYGTDKEKEIILSFLNEEEKEIFLKAVGFYQLFTDTDFYKNVQTAIAEQIWNEAHGLS